VKGGDKRMLQLEGVGRGVWSFPEKNVELNFDATVIPT
jgi:hypothetical protein